MNHGVENEINGIATLVSVIMPTFYPDLVFHEEGCYVIERDSSLFCVVSPEGILRQKSTVEKVVEIKCPYPNR